jgi:hypothetical protein
MTAGSNPPNWLSDRVAVTRLEEKLENLARRADDHEKRDDERFGRMFEFMELAEDRVNKKLDKMDGLLQMLLADKNRRDGALSAGRVIAGFIGGLVTLVGEFAFKKLMG